MDVWTVGWISWWATCCGWEWQEQNMSVWAEKTEWMTLCKGLILDYTTGLPFTSLQLLEVFILAAKNKCNYTAFKNSKDIEKDDSPILNKIN